MNRSSNNQLYYEETSQNYSFNNQSSSWYDYSSSDSVYNNNFVSPSIATSSPQSSVSYSSTDSSYYYPYYNNSYYSPYYYNNYYNNSVNYTFSDNSQNNEQNSNQSSIENHHPEVSTFNKKILFTPEKSMASKTSRHHRKQLLPDSAVDLMNEWFDDHINNPYPTLEEKEKIAQKGGITVKQVTAWFSNRRNRSQNTKPKRIRRAIEQEMNSVINQLTYNPNKTEIIEKLKTLF